MNISIPDNLDLSKHFQRKKDIEKAAYLIHYILKGVVRSSTNKEAYTPVCYEMLRKHIGRCDHILTTLKEAGIIICDNVCIRGSKSFGYKLGIRYSDAKLISRELKLNIRKKKLSAVVKLLLQHLEQLTIVDVPYHDTIRLEGEDNHKIISYDADIHYIKTKSWECSEDNYGRCFTNLTRLPSHLRKYLRINGEPLVSFDIKNSHPYFLGMLAYLTKLKGDKFILPKFNLLLSNNTSDYLNFSSEILDNDINHSAVEPSIPLYEIADVKSFIHSVCHGSFYEQMAVRENCSRNDIKLSYQYINGKKEPGYIKKHFPTMSKFIRHLKRKGYLEFSHTLQRYESKVVLQKISKHILTSTDIPLLTCHDCFYTVKSRANDLETVLNEQFNTLPLQPAIKKGL